jgi:hypothetical protein
MALAQHSASPSCTHLLAAKGIIHYLSGTTTHCLAYGVSNDSTVGYVDTDWAQDKSNCISVSGYVYKVLGSIVAWSLLKQHTPVLSSMEAEYMLLTHTLK